MREEDDNRMFAALSDGERSKVKNIRSEGRVKKTGDGPGPRRIGQMEDSTGTEIRRQYRYRGT